MRDADTHPLSRTSSSGSRRLGVHLVWRWRAGSVRPAPVAGRVDRRAPAPPPIQPDRLCHRQRGKLGQPAHNSRAERSLATTTFGRRTSKTSSAGVRAAMRIGTGDRSASGSRKPPEHYWRTIVRLAADNTRAGQTARRRRTPFRQALDPFTSGAFLVRNACCDAGRWDRAASRARIPIRIS
jgi:hypothetical protein